MGDAGLTGLGVWTPTAVRLITVVARSPVETRRRWTITAAYCALGCEEHCGCRSCRPRRVQVAYAIGQAAPVVGLYV